MDILQDDFLTADLSQLRGFQDFDSQDGWSPQEQEQLTQTRYWVNRAEGAEIWIMLRHDHSSGYIPPIMFNSLSLEAEPITPKINILPQSIQYQVVETNK